jgi:hypothetical protein
VEEGAKAILVDIIDTNVGFRAFLRPFDAFLALSPSFFSRFYAAMAAAAMNLILSRGEGAIVDLCVVFDRR